MEHEAFYSALLGACPTVLIAFALEIRLVLPGLPSESLPGARRFAYVALWANLASGTVALLALMNGKGSWLDHYTVAWAAGIGFILALGSLVGLLSGGIRYGVGNK